MDLVIYELKLRNKYLSDMKKNKIKIKKIAKDFSQYSIIPVDIIHKVIKNYDCDYNHINIIKNNYEIKKEILKLSIPLIKNQIHTYYHDDIDNEKYSDEIFFKILERILKNFRFKITYNSYDYLGRYTLMVSRY